MSTIPSQLTPMQRAFHGALRIMADHALDDFNMLAAVRQMIALEYDWVGEKIIQARAFDPAFNSEKLERHLFEDLVTKAQNSVKALVDDAVEDAVINVEEPAWAGLHKRRNGFSVIIRVSGYVNIFFTPNTGVGTTSGLYGDGRVHWHEFQTLHSRRVAQYFGAKHPDLFAAPRKQPQPFDLTPGRRKLLLLQE